MKFNEQVTVENYIIKFIKDTLGFEYIKPEEFAKYRELETEYIITPLLERAISALNPTANESEIKNVIREVKKIETTGELARIIEGVKPRHGKINPATQVFQALRIAVNDEMHSLEEALPLAVELLEDGGRLVVISFHKFYGKW